jgi:hypothetical protein
VSEGDLQQVSAEGSDGRVLTGVGTTVEALEKTMERHTDSEPAAEPAATATNGNGSEAPKEKRGAKRFDQLTAEREEARRDAEAAKKERDDLRAQLAQPKPASEPASKAIVTPDPAVEAAPLPTARTKPSEDEVGTKYKSYAEFAEDLADWKYEQKFGAQDFDTRVRAALAADRAQQARHQVVATALERGKAAYPDWEDVVYRGPASDINIGRDDAASTARMESVLRLPNAEHILYALGKDAEQTARLSKLSDVEFGLALAQFSPAVTSVASSPASTGARSVVAPPPFQPVGSGSKTTVVPSSELPKRSGYDFDKSGYREKRAAERGMRRR